MSLNVSSEMGFENIEVEKSILVQVLLYDPPL